MTTTLSRSSEAQPYLDALRSRLGELPEEDRTDLLKETEAHIVELLAEDSETPLVDRIGAPEDYAEELAASMGLDEKPPRSFGGTVVDAIGQVGEHPLAIRFRAYVRELRPAWWAIRGLAIGLLLTWDWLGLGDPWHHTWVRAFAVLVVLGTIAVSTSIGRKGLRARSWRWLSITATIVALVAGVLFAGNLSHQLSASYNSLGDDYYIEEGYYLEEGYGASTTTMPSPMLTTPDVTGLTIAAAIDGATAAGFVVEVDGPARQGYVGAQAPPPGQQVPEETTLVIYAP